MFKIFSKLVGIALYNLLHKSKPYIFHPHYLIFIKYNIFTYGVHITTNTYIYVGYKSHRQ